MSRPVRSPTALRRSCVVLERSGCWLYGPVDSDTWEGRPSASTRGKVHRARHSMRRNLGRPDARWPCHPQCIAPAHAVEPGDVLAGNKWSSLTTYQRRAEEASE